MAIALIAVPFALVIEYLARSGDTKVVSSIPLTASTATAETGPQADGRHLGIELRWSPPAGAAFYNVILWRGRTRALDLWPRRAVVDLSTRSLPRGTYRWFVYPAYESKRGHRYGELIARGIVRIKA